jgi:hypothetical protein
VEDLTAVRRPYRNATGSPALEVSESGIRFGYSAPPWQLHVPTSIGGGDRSFRSRW